MGVGDRPEGRSHYPAAPWSEDGRPGVHVRPVTRVDVAVAGQVLFAAQIMLGGEAETELED